MVSFAYVLDLIFGDPRWFPHPVKIIGSFIKQLEILLYKYKTKKLSGSILVIIVISTSFLITWLLIKTCSTINIYLGVALQIMFIYTTLSIKDLKLETMQVYYTLKQDNIDSARKNLAMIVGRDTKNLDRREIIRATVETIAENTVDGIISPLFYAFIGGAPLAVAYKAVNTLDSTIGYKTEKYIDFGFAASRLDDIANFIPARISILLLPIACLLAGKNAKKCLQIILRDRNRNPSPNSGIPEAAIAGALGVQLGGLNSYNSVAVMKPFLGDNINPLEKKHIKEAIKIAYICSALTLILGMILCLTIKHLTGQEVN